MQIEHVNPITDPAWRALVDLQQSSVFHSPEWIQAVTETYHFDVDAAILRDDGGSVVAGFPMVRVADMRGRRILVFPFSDYYDPLVTDLRQWELLLEPLLAQRVLIRFRCLHNEIPLGDQRFSLVNRAKWHGVALTGNLEEQWQHIAPECQRAIRKAERAGLRAVRAQDLPAMREFFEMHLRIRKHKYHLLAQPYHFFEKIWEHLIASGHGTVLRIYHGDEAVGAAVFLRWQGKCYYKFGASKFEYLALRPNDLLIWAGIQYAKECGDNFLDLGLSDWDQHGLIAFKRKFASTEKTISFLEHSPELIANGAQLSPELLPTLTKLFTDTSVPDTITERAGELLYRYFV